MRYIKHLVRRYPMQSLSGDDIWIYIPTWVNTLTSHSLESIRTLYGASGLT